jgi:hypothetical protein
MIKYEVKMTRHGKQEGEGKSRHTSCSIATVVGDRGSVPSIDDMDTDSSVLLNMLALRRRRNVLSNDKLSWLDSKGSILTMLTISTPIRQLNTGKPPKSPSNNHRPVTYESRPCSVKVDDRRLYKSP